MPDVTNQPIRLKAGSTIGPLTEVEEKQVDDLQPLTTGEVSDIEDIPETEGNHVPEHLESLYEATKHCCEGPVQSRRLARLLTKYSTVFSTGNGDVR